ncbi:MAG TPA: hypothetical protein VGD67_09900 [Pseudonocardiaceae bacterium]
MNAVQLWAVVRDGLGEAPEILAVLHDRPAAAALVAELGEGHDVAPAPLVPAGARATVVHTWRCRARVAGGAVAAGEPERLAGASRLVLPGESVPVVERVDDDQAADDLAALVSGERVRHVVAYGATAARAAELAMGRARELAAGS